MSSQLINPLQFFADLTGLPLNAGYVYVGQPNTNPLTNPVVVYQDLAMTIPMVQPLRTIQGVISLNGQPLPVYVASSGYSILVTDRKGNIVWSQASVTDPIGAASQLVQNLTTTLAGSTGSSLVGFIQAGVGAISRTMQSKGRDLVNTNDFGGQSAGDVSNAFQNAVNALPASGGQIDVPSAAYLINTAPNEGAKSVVWNFGVGTSFTGASGWPRMVTNVAQVPVGMYIKSQSSVASPTGGGIAALNVEMLAPASYVGQSVAAYIGATGSNPSTSANVWAINCLINVAAAAGGTYQCIEVDVDNFSPSALVKGISINGVGSVNPQVGLEVIRTGGATKWNFGIDIYNCVAGIRLNTAGMSRGIVIGNPAAIGNTALSALQMADGADSIVIQRATDTTPTGFAIRLVNAANTATPFSVDISGNISTQGLVTASSLFISGPAVKTGTGTLTLGAGTSQTVGAAGPAAALPANPLAYFQWLLGSTPIKVPYYNA